MQKTGRKIIYAGGGALILALLFVYLRHRGYEPVYFAALMGLAGVSVVRHVRRAVKEKGYLGKLCSIAPDPDRVAAFDHLRLLALCGVIVTHAVQIDLEAGAGAASKGAAALWVVTMAANAAYVMLSGALLYRQKEEKLSVFYLRKFSAVVVPLVVYYLWYLSANYGFARGWTSASWRDILEWLMTNRMNAAPHMWLVYAILSVYLTVPFFRIALRDFPYRKLTAILTALFVIRAGVPVLNALVTSPLTGADLALNVPFSGWLLASLYGYWVCLEQSRRYDKITIPLGACALIIMAVIAAHEPGEAVLSTWCLNDAALPLMLCVGLFAAVLRLGRFFAGTGPVAGALCRYSYGIILIHWYTLHFIVIDRFHVRALSAGGLGVLLSLALTLVFSWGICLLMDNLIVLPLQLLWGRLFRLEKRGNRFDKEREDAGYGKKTADTGDAI